MLRIIMVILLLMALGGCTVNEEKTIFQMARTKQEEIIKIRVTHAGRTIDLSDDKAVAQILQPMATAVPALDAGNTRIGSLSGGDYVIDAFSSLAGEPVRFYYNSEKQWLYFTKGAKRVHPYKCENLLQSLSYLFEINSFRVMINEKEGLPQYFDVVDWLSKKKFYGLRGDQFHVWDTEKGTSELFLTDVWSLLLSPDHTRLAYTNKKGLNIFDLNTLKSANAVRVDKKVPAATTNPVCWSPDSGRLMNAVEHEWHSDFFVLDLKTNKSTPFTFKNVANFLSTPVAWLKNGNLLFIVSSATSKEGSRAYMSAGYRSDLMEATPDGSFRKVTALEDGQYITFAGLTENEQEALVLIRNQQGAERKVALVNLADGKIAYLSLPGHTVSTKISPDGRFVASTTPLEENLRGYRLELLDRHTGETIFHYENREYTAEKRFLWHANSRAFFYLDKSMEDASKNKFRQVVILPG